MSATSVEGLTTKHWTQVRQCSLNSRRGDTKFLVPNLCEAVPMLVPNLREAVLHDFKTCNNVLFQDIFPLNTLLDG